MIFLENIKKIKLLGYSMLIVFMGKLREEDL